jgi:PhzF family phenazine biosynthesis protein
MTKSRKFYQINVFSDAPYSGNPVAVVLDGDDLTTQQMQQFANWTNLSETTFILKPTHPLADYAVRIFTTTRELPFAGHPTLGSCYAWLTSGGRSKDPKIVIQECQQGLIPLRWIQKCVEDTSAETDCPSTSILSFEAPKLNQSGPLAEVELEALMRGLGLSRDEIIAHSWCDNGPPWRGLLLSSSEKVLSLRPNQMILRTAGLDGTSIDFGVIGPCVERTSECDYDFEVRAFCPEEGSSFEDPVTGSLNAAMAQWLIETGRAPQEGYIVRQGTCVGRDGRVFVRTRQESYCDSTGEREREGGGEGKRTVWIGGQCTLCVDGEVRI